jgi:hypothetical protein
MKNIFLIIMSILFVSIAQAEKVQPTLNKTGLQPKPLMTSTDRLGDSTSNISIQNTSGAQTFTVTGIFIQQLFQADCTTSYFDNHGELYGTMWSSNISFSPSASTPLGAGYLYSMMINYLYEAAQNGGPAATTPGNGAGTWCIQLGILQGGNAKYPTYSVSTNTSPSASLSNVVTWTNNTNPAPIAITCDDSSQQCTATSASIQEFPQ